MRKRIRQEQIRMLYAHRLSVLAGSFVIGLISTVVLWQSADKQLLAVWFSMTAILVVIRWRLTDDYHRKSREEQDERYQHWALQFTTGSFVNGILWGVVPLIPYTENANNFSLILIMHAGYISGAALATSIYLPALLAFVLPSSVLFVIGTLVRGLENWPYAFLIVCYLITIVIYANRNNRSVMEQVMLRLENAELLTNLRAQRDKAERAVMDKNRFLAAASHDLRQPVHALGLFVSSLKTREDPEQRRYILGKISQSTEALASLFHGLLDLSKLDAKVLENNPETVNLDELMSVIESQFQYTASEKNLELHVENTTQLAAFVDGALLERILRNLVSNAIKYTIAGSVSVVIESKSDQLLTIAVKDTGIGIEHSEFENIFSEYHQLRNPERDRRNGLGLGLAIVRRLCQLMNIPISVDSEPGRGSVFTLTLPKADKRQITPTTPNVASVGHESLSIVVIDDEQDIVDGMERLLTDWGHKTIVATSIEGALSALEDESAPDAIIADFRLRGEASGLDAIKIICDEFNCDIPALLITGDTAPERLIEAASASVPVLYKPVEPAALREALARIAHEVPCNPPI